MDKPSVLLIRPLIREYLNSQSSDTFESSIGLVPPLGLCCLAAEAEQAGFGVAIFDCEAHDNSDDHLERYLAEHQPDVVGISILTTNFRGALHTARIARRVLPRAKIVCGGTHMMIFPQETLSYPEFDFGFVGEAEKSLVQFLGSFQSEGVDLSTIAGLVWRDGDAVVVNEPWGFNEDLDSLQPPAYHLLDLSKYQMPNTNGTLVSLFLSRGCPFKCGFCFRNPQLRKVRFKSVDKIIDEIELMVTKHNIRSINFVDETISLKKDYFLEFCDKLASKPWNIEWQAPTRAPSVDEDVVRAAKKAGCHTFRMGIESGSDEILKKIDKSITTEQSSRAVALCKKAKIKVVTYFIIGYLGESEATIKQTIAFAKKLNPDYAAFFPATPMPGTELCRQCEEMGLIPENYWKDFVLGRRSESLPFIFPDAGQWTDRAYKQFYFSPRYLCKQLKTLKFYKNFFKNAKLALKLLFMKFNR